MQFTMTADATVVSNRFIDEYLCRANGEYVKIYLWFLRHAGEDVSVDTAADDLEMTETDVRRALAYWRKIGIMEKAQREKESCAPEKGTSRSAEGHSADANADAEAKEETQISAARQDSAEKTAGADGHGKNMVSAAAQKSGQTPAGKEMAAADRIAVDMSALSVDETFKQLLYIAQRYLNKLFTQRDTEVLGNLYQNLHMSPELLEYLLEYCAQNNHTSLRYVEKVALSWHEKGMKTPEEVQRQEGKYNRQIYTVLRAMGLGDRQPAAVEKAYIEKWFGEYGFAEEVVEEACNRTMNKLHTPNFAYCEGILAGWRKEGIRTMADIAEADARHARRQGDGKKRGGNGSGTGGKSGRASGRTNRFDNFEGRGMDYDQLIWNNLGGGHGTQ